jgi:dTDP-4-amino-4,6-dideoxygalactose transaminase
MHNPLRLYSFTSGTTSLAETLGALIRFMALLNVKNGPNIERFERTVASYLGVRRGFAFSSGRMALYSILKAITEDSRDQVILPAYTCVAVPTAILYAGYKPVYVDINPDTFNIDVDQVEARITARTRAILAPHNYGNACDIVEIVDIAKRRGIVVIEDCAHSLGSELDGRKLGTFGDFSFISTDHTKVISTSIGGLAFVNNTEYEDAFERIYAASGFLSTLQLSRVICQFLLLNFFHHPAWYRLGRVFQYLYHRTGLPFFLPGSDGLCLPKDYPYPARLSDIQCWIGCQQMAVLEHNIKHRRKISQKYRDVLGPYFAIQKVKAGCNPVPLRFAFLVNDRPGFVRFVSDLVAVETWFDSVFQNYRGDLVALGYAPGSCPTAEKITQHVVNLPTHPKVSLRLPELLSAMLQAPEAARFYTQLPEPVS